MIVLYRVVLIVTAVVLVVFLAGNCHAIVESNISHVDSDNTVSGSIAWNIIKETCKRGGLYFLGIALLAYISVRLG
ncbi:hypothetical protein KW790_03465 [Candidatus Parcubacteria bacterium]|nr:hypothetical protein [Candidatus Parcubacteria bacterium]